MKVINLLLLLFFQISVYAQQIKQEEIKGLSHSLNIQSLNFKNLKNTHAGEINARLLNNLWLQDSSKKYHYVTILDSFLIDISYNNYNKNGYIVEEISKSRNESHENFNNTKRIWEYLGDTINVIYYQEDELSGNLIYDFKFERIYDLNNNLTSEIKSVWDANLSKWEFVEKEEVKYADKNILSKVSYTYVNNNWLGSRKHTYEYDEEKLLNHTYFIWDINYNDWWPINQVISHYDADDQLDYEVDYYYTDQWIKVGKHEHVNEYRKLSILNYSYKNDEWQLSYKNVKEYDLNDNVLSSISYDYIEENKEWEMRSSLQFTYNDFNRTTSFKSERKNPKSNLWEKNILFEYIFEKETLISSIFYKGDNKLGDWVLTNKSFFYSHKTITNIENDWIKNIEDNITIFPNPALDKIHISYSNESDHSTNNIIYFYNSSGLLLGNHICNKNGWIDIGELSAGIIIYRIIQDDKIISSGKFIKR